MQYHVHPATVSYVPHVGFELQTSALRFPSTGSGVPRLTCELKLSLYASAWQLTW